MAQEAGSARVGAGYRAGGADPPRARDFLYTFSPLYANKYIIARRERERQASCVQKRPTAKTQESETE